MAEWPAWEQAEPCRDPVGWVRVIGGASLWLMVRISNGEGTCSSSNFETRSYKHLWGEESVVTLNCR